MLNKTVAIVGYGAAGKNLHQLFPQAVIYDAPLGLGSKQAVNRCDYAFVAVPTNQRPDGSCDTSIVEEVVDWLARIGQTGRAVLVTAEIDDRVGRATANLREFELRTPGTLRLEDILRAETVLVLRPALDGLAARATVGSAE